MNDDEMIVLQACENGRGAVLLSVARGKVSEGIDFGKTSVSCLNLYILGSMLSTLSLLVGSSIH